MTGIIIIIIVIVLHILIIIVNLHIQILISHLVDIVREHIDVHVALCVAILLLLPSLRTSMCAMCTVHALSLPLHHIVEHALVVAHVVAHHEVVVTHHVLAAVVVAHVCVHTVVVHHLVHGHVGHHAALLAVAHWREDDVLVQFLATLRKVRQRVRDVLLGRLFVTAHPLHIEGFVQSGEVHVLDFVDFGFLLDAVDNLL